MILRHSFRISAGVTPVELLDSIHEGDVVLASIWTAASADRRELQSS